MLNYHGGHNFPDLLSLADQSMGTNCNFTKLIADEIQSENDRLYTVITLDDQSRRMQNSPIKCLIRYKPGLCLHPCFKNPLERL